MLCRLTSGSISHPGSKRRGHWADLPISRQLILPFQAHSVVAAVPCPPTLLQVPPGPPLHGPTLCECLRLQPIDHQTSSQLEHLHQSTSRLPRHRHRHDHRQMARFMRDLACSASPIPFQSLDRPTKVRRQGTGAGCLAIWQRRGRRRERVPTKGYGKLRMTRQTESLVHTLQSMLLPIHCSCL